MLRVRSEPLPSMGALAVGTIISIGQITMSLYNQLKLLALDLSPGESRRDECPVCSKREGFVITRTDDGDIIWICHRATCDLAPGRISSEGGMVSTTRAATVPKRPSGPTQEDIREQLVPLTDEHRAFLAERYGLLDEHLIKTTVLSHRTSGRVAFKIQGHDGHLRGWVLRDTTGAATTKALTRRLVPASEPLLSWYVSTPKGSTVLVVEDIPSSMRASKYLTSCAMISGGIGELSVKELAKYYRKVIWAFDNDNIRGAIKHQKRWGGWFKESTVLYLHKDLKDMREDELCHILT